MTITFSESERRFILSKLKEGHEGPFPENSNPASYAPLANRIQDQLRVLLKGNDAATNQYCLAVTDNALRRLVYYRVLNCDQDLLDGLYLYFSPAPGLKRLDYLAKNPLPDLKAFDNLQKDPAEPAQLFEFLRLYPFSERYQQVLALLKSSFERNKGAFFSLRGLVLLVAGMILGALAIWGSERLRETPSRPQRSVVWNLVTTWPDNSTYSTVLRDFARKLEERMKAQANIDLTIKIQYNSHLPDGKPMKPEKLLAGLRGPTPLFELLHTTPYYYSDSFPRTPLYSAMPFGRFRIQMKRWLDDPVNYQGLRFIFATEKDSSILTFPGGFTGAQYGGWFKFNNAEEFYAAMESDQLFRGKKGRYAGFAGKVLREKYGANIQTVKPADITKEVFNNHFDFYEWVGPGMDMEIGLHTVKGFNVYCLSSWHEPCTMMTLSVNKNRLDELNQLNPEAGSIFKLLVDSTFYGINSDSIYEKTRSMNEAAIQQLVALGIDTVSLSMPYLNQLKKNTDDFMEQFLGSLKKDSKVNQSTLMLFKSYRDIKSQTTNYRNALKTPDLD